MGLFKLFSKIKTQHNPNLDEIKKFFFDYHGSHMWMDRDEPSKYKQYVALDDSIKSQWRQELIAKDLKLLKKPSKETWIIVRDLIGLLSYSKKSVELDCEKLLIQIIKISPALDKQQKILILEHLACGGMHLFASYPTLKKLVLTAIHAVSNFTIDISDNSLKYGWENMQQRYDNAQTAVQQAFKDSFK